MLDLFANDDQRLLQGATWAPHLAAGPLLLISGMAYAISLIGVWALIGFAIFLLMLPLQVRTFKAIDHEYKVGQKTRPYLTVYNSSYDSAEIRFIIKMFATVPIVRLLF